jgi:hypothetical protein
VFLLLNVPIIYQETSSVLMGKSYYFLLFLFFVISILLYFPFHHYFLKIAIVLRKTFDFKVNNHHS